MGTKRLPSPTEKDFDRIAETIMNDDHFKKITDYQSFDEAYRDYFEDQIEFQENSAFENKVFDKILFDYGRVKDTRMVTGKPKVVKRGKRAYFMEVIDGKKVYNPVPKQHYEKHEFTFVGYQKEKIVYSYEAEIMRYNKKTVIHRGKNGQFVKIKKSE